MISDKQARKLIVHGLDKNYFVEASAGSGKTTSLVYRMVALVESGVPVEQICTITFTKAAANEFFSRFQSVLSKRSVNKYDAKLEKALGSSDGTKQAFCQKALNDIDLCFLGTMDSFCNMVAHELPTELGLPNSSDIVSEAQMMDIFKEEYYLMLKDPNHELHDLAVIVNNNLYPPYECFSTALYEIINNRDANVIFNNNLLNADIDECLKNEKQYFIDLVKVLADTDVNFGAAKAKDAYKKLTSCADRVIKYKWNESLSSVITALKQFKNMDGSIPTSITGTALDDPRYAIKPEGKRNYSFSPDAINLCNKIDTFIKEYLFQVLLTLVTKAVKNVSNKLKLQGKFSFYDYLLYLTEAFKESASGNREIINHLYNKHKYILIDESQDTNPLQTQLFFYLTSSKVVPNGDWTKAEPKEGSLFIVGDPKQSIYAFRGANVQVYKKTKELFEAKNELLILSNNYRSNPPLKKWFNSTMDGFLNKGPDALKHEDIPDEDPDGRQDMIDKEPKILDGVFRYVAGKQDPEVVANYINYLVNSGNYVILPKEPDEGKPLEPRKIRYSDFLIVPRTAKVDKYIESFEKSNIPFIIEADIPFGNSKTLLAIVDVLYLLKNPNNPSYLTNVLAGDLFHLANEDLIQIRKDGFNLKINEYDQETTELSNNDHKAIIESLFELYKKTQYLSFSSTLLTILNSEELKVFDYISSQYLEYTYFLIEKIKEKENSGEISSFADLQNYLSSFLSKSDENRCLRFEDKVDAVKVSNLHKVKGLQAPIVMLVKPNASKMDASKFIDYTGLKPNLYLSSINVDNGHGNKTAVAKTTQFDAEITKWNDAQHAEDKRLEYVGATRPESVLFVVDGHHDSDERNPWEDLLEKADKEMEIYGDIAGFTPEPDTEKIENIPFKNALIKAECKAESYEIKTPSTAKVKTVVSNEEPDIEKEEAKKDATVQGTVVHALMECLVTSNGEFKKDELINSLIKQYPEAEEYKATIEKVYDVVTNGGFEQLNSSLNKDILTTLRNAKEVMCEVPFSFKEDNSVVYGVIDCLYQDEQGWHIIDYKTNKQKDVQKLESEYKNQLELYQKALKQTTGINADTHIYHIDL